MMHDDLFTAKHDDLFTATIYHASGRVGITFKPTPSLTRTELLKLIERLKHLAAQMKD